MDYWTLKKKAIMGSMQSGRLTEAEGYPLKLENAIKGNMKDYKIWGNKKGKNYLDISKIVATPNSTANLFISEVNSDTGSVIIFSTDAYTGGGYCNTGKFLKNIAPHLEVGKTYFLNGTSQSSAKRMYLTTSKYIWNFGTSHTITEDDLNSAIVLYGLSAQNGQGTGICKIEGLSITEEETTEYEPYQENDGLGTHTIENLFDIGTIADWENGTSASLTIADDVITAYVESGSGHYFFKNTYYPSGTYSVFIEERTNNTDAIFIIRLYDADGNELTANAGYSVSGNFVWNSYYKGFTKSANYGTYFIIPKSVSSWKLGFAVNGTAGTKATLSKIMLAEGDKCVKYRKNNYIDIVSRSKNWLKATCFYSFCGNNYSTLIEDGRNCVRFIDDGRKYANAHLTFRPNTRYTVSFDCKTVKRSSSNTTGSCVFRFFYDDGSNSSIYVEQNADWTHRTLSSMAGKTVAYIGLVSYNFTNWCYIDIDTFQLEEGDTATPYEPYIEPITTTIDLTGHNSIMPNDYIDFKNQAIVRSDGTKEDITLPKIPLHKGYNILTASDAELEATKMYGKYLKKG